ncbi:MAG: DUF4191 domain-containing protein [Propionibacteriaceae bacterium]
MAASDLTPRQAKAQAAAKQKAALQAEKARKKASTDPTDMGRFRQIYQAYKVTHEYDPSLPFLLAGAVLVPLLTGLVVGIVLARPLFIAYLGLLGLLVGLMLAMLLLVRRAKRASYKRYAGQAGSAEVALNMLPKQWSSTAAIAATRQMDAVHRALGPGGLVLVGEGEASRVRALLTAEAKKHQRVNDRMTVTTLMMGQGQGQVPLEKLADHIRKLPKTLQPHEITEIKARLTALDAVRPRMPIPKGPMPTARGSRSALRGR